MSADKDVAQLERDRVFNTELGSIHEEMTAAFNSTVTQHALDA